MTTEPKPARLARLTAQYGSEMAAAIVAVRDAPAPPMKSRQPERPDDPLAVLEARIARALTEYREATRRAVL
jgi:hypothetical protein